METPKKTPLVDEQLLKSKSPEEFEALVRAASPEVDAALTKYADVLQSGPQSGGHFADSKIRYS